MLPIQSLNLSNNRTRCKEIHECYITFKYILYIISYEIIFSSGKLSVDIISNCTWQKTEVCTMHGEQEMYCWASLAPTSSYSSLGCFKAIQLTPLSICINIWRFVDGQSINNEFIHEWPNYSPFTKYYKTFWPETRIFCWSSWNSSFVCWWNILTTTFESRHESSSR